MGILGSLFGDMSRGWGGVQNGLNGMGGMFGNNMFGGNDNGPQGFGPPTPGPSMDRTFGKQPGQLGGDARLQFPQQQQMPQQGYGQQQGYPPQGGQQPFPFQTFPGMMQPYMPFGMSPYGGYGGFGGGGMGSWPMPRQPPMQPAAPPPPPPGPKVVDAEGRAYSPEDKQGMGAGVSATWGDNEYKGTPANRI